MPLLLGKVSSPQDTTTADQLQPSPHNRVGDNHQNEHHGQDSAQLPHPPLHEVDLSVARTRHEREQEQEHYTTIHSQEESLSRPELQLRKGSQSQVSDLAKTALLSSMTAHAKGNITMHPAVARPHIPVANLDGTMDDALKVVGKAPASLAVSERPSSLRHRHTEERVGFATGVKEGDAKPRPIPHGNGNTSAIVVGSPTAMNDTPATTAPSSPNM